MADRFCVVLVLAVLAHARLDAQNNTVPNAVLEVRTARTALRAASTAMGVDTLKSVQYSGSGWDAAVGQSFKAGEDWPRFELSTYTRTIDYDAKYSRQELIRRQGQYPLRGGGGTPLQVEQRQISLVNGEYAWNLEGNIESPVFAEAEVRQLDIWLSPHGFVKAAIAANATGMPMTLQGRRVTMVTFLALGKYRVNGTINDQNLVERVQTWIPNPIFGDMLYEHEYAEYKDFAGVKFPTVLRSRQGDPRLNAGNNSMEIRITNVVPNVTVEDLTVAYAVKQAFIPVALNESQRRTGLIRVLADKVWLIAGLSHSSVVVEFRDFVAVIEAPLNEERSLWVIPEVRRLVANKPIKYVVNTHHHFDHAGGIRTYVATHGASVITHPSNRDFYESVLLHPAPRRLQPDLLATLYPAFNGNRQPSIETATEPKHVLSDGTRTMEIYPVQGLAHSADMLMVYLPTEKILVNADLYSPRPADEPPPAVDASMQTLYDNIQRLKLSVVQHVPIHGVPGSHDDFLRVLGKSSN